MAATKAGWKMMQLSSVHEAGRSGYATLQADFDFQQQRKVQLLELSIGAAFLQLPSSKSMTLQRSGSSDHNLEGN